MCADESSQHDLPPEVQLWLDEHPKADANALAEVWRLSGDVPPTMTPDPERVSALRKEIADATEGDQRSHEPEATTTLRCVALMG